MPKIIELTIEIKIDKVSCPGVWLCQYGNVSLTMFALGTGYQTSFLPPVFPLLFKDVFYFQKKFQASCGLNNIACMLKDESIYCELIQWTDDLKTNQCFILAQYLGTLTDVLFPPNVCSLDGVDLLMRRTDIFPGILAPKIEISTKVRIDEVWDKVDRKVTTKPNPKSATCQCKSEDYEKPGKVCHSPSYHWKAGKTGNASRNRPRSQSSEASRMCYTPNKHPRVPVIKSRTSLSCFPHRKSRPLQAYCDYNASVPETCFRNINKRNRLGNRDSDDKSPVSLDRRTNNEDQAATQREQRKNKVILKSNFIEQDTALDEVLTDEIKEMAWRKTRPCECAICKRYHELFHCDNSK